MHLPLSPIPDHVMPGILRAVHMVAEFISTERARFSHEAVEIKGYNNFVSYVDRQVEEHLRVECEKLLPGSGFIGEEGDDLRVNAEYRWIVDPLDGTTNFIHDIPTYAVSIALQHKERTILGIVHDVPRKETFHAMLGGGAFVNGQPIKVSPAEKMAGALLATGFPYANSGILDDYLAVMKTFLGQCHGIRRFGAAAVDMAWVACGRLEGFYEIGLNPWDVAAGGLIIQEAGGAVSDFKGTDNYIFGKQLVASNGLIHSEMLRVLRPHG